MEWRETAVPYQWDSENKLWRIEQRVPNEFSLWRWMTHVLCFVCILPSLKTAQLYAQELSEDLRFLTEFDGTHTWPPPTTGT